MEEQEQEHVVEEEEEEHVVEEEEEGKDCVDYHQLAPQQGSQTPQVRATCAYIY